MRTENSLETPTDHFDEVGPLWRDGHYVGDDFRIVLSVFTRTSLNARDMALNYVRSDGAADLKALFARDIDYRAVSSWQCQVSDVDASDAVAIAFADEVPTAEFLKFLDVNKDFRGSLTYESNAVRGAIYTMLRKRKPVVEEHKVRWWSAETGYKDVSYAEFVRIHGERP